MAACGVGGGLCNPLCTSHFEVAVVSGAYAGRCGRVEGLISFYAIMHLIVASVYNVYVVSACRNRKLRPGRPRERENATEAKGRSREAGMGEIPV